MNLKHSLAKKIQKYVILIEIGEKNIFPGQQWSKLLP